MGGLGSIKVSDCPKYADMLAAFAVFSMLTLGVDIKGSTCPGNLTSEWPVSSHSTRDRISSILPERFTKVSTCEEGEGTLLVETRTLVPLDASKWAGTVGLGEWYPLSVVILVSWTMYLDTSDMSPEVNQILKGHHMVYQLVKGTQDRIYDSGPYTYWEHHIPSMFYWPYSLQPWSTEIYFQENMTQPYPAEI